MMKFLCRGTARSLTCLRGYPFECLFSFRLAYTWAIQDKANWSFILSPRGAKETTGRFGGPGASSCNRQTFKGGPCPGGFKLKI